MATEQSERIRAALLRAKANRQSSNSPIAESVKEPEPCEPAVLEAESISAEPSLAEATEENAAPEYEPLEDVETTLPLVAASEEERVVLFRDTIASASPSPLALEDTPALLPQIDAKSVPSASRFPRNALIVGGVIALVGLSLFFLNRLWQGSQPSGTGGSFPLQLQVESQGNGILNVRWNPQSTAVIEAREGRLAIVEHGQQTRTIALSAEQLKIGHLYYQSPAERVEFRMEIVDRSGGVAKESVLALSSGANAEPSAGPPIAPSPDQPSTPSTKTPKAATAQPQPDSSRVANTREQAKTPPTQQQPSRPPIRSFAPPPSQPKAEETRAVLLDDAPPVVPSGSVVPPLVSLPEAAARIPAPQVKEPPPAAPAQLKPGGNLQAPKLIKRVTPVYPAAAQAANIQGKVRFTAAIGKDGKIQNVQVVSGHPVLIPAATEAVKKWVYEPMKLNGEPTEVITQIEVNFALRQ